LIFEILKTAGEKHIIHFLSVSFCLAFSTDFVERLCIEQKTLSDNDLKTTSSPFCPFWGKELYSRDDLSLGDICPKNTDGENIHDERILPFFHSLFFSAKMTLSTLKKPHF
jgi:hypothetical protein